MNPNPFDHVPLAFKHLRPCQTPRKFVEAGTSRGRHHERRNGGAESSPPLTTFGSHHNMHGEASIQLAEMERAACHILWRCMDKQVCPEVYTRLYEWNWLTLTWPVVTHTSRATTPHPGCITCPCACWASRTPAQLEKWNSARPQPLT